MSGRNLLQALGAIVLVLFLVTAFTPLPNHLDRAIGLVLSSVQATVFQTWMTSRGPRTLTRDEA